MKRHNQLINDRKQTPTTCHYVHTYVDLISYSSRRRLVVLLTPIFFGTAVYFVLVKVLPSKPRPSATQRWNRHIVLNLNMRRRRTY